MDLVFENLVGRRETKGEAEAVVMAEVTKGNFRISSDVAAKLGITDGSFVVMQHEKTTDTVYIGKGKDGDAIVDENGEYVVDARGHRTYEEGKEGFGALAREITPGSGVIRTSVSAAWAAIGGDTEKKKLFTLGEGVEVTLPTGNGTFATTLYPLEFLREEDKMERNSSDKKDGSNSNEDANGQVEESNGFQAEAL